MEKIRAVALCGPTACGKSDLALSLCTRFPFEIVCMDSMQVYRGMDIGTAKPTREERQQVPHHLLDVAEPDQPFSVAEYVEMALPVCREITSRRKIPLFVGGTGLYLKALLHGLSLGEVGEDPALRQELNQIALEENGKLRLHRMLEELNPERASQLHPNDLRRVIRAIEIARTGGEKPRETESDYDLLPLCIRMERAQLYERVEKRVDRMLEAGLPREVLALKEAGIGAQMQSMQGIGYKELFPWTEGKASLEEARREIVLATRHYAKRQETWFKGEKAMIFLEAGKDLPERASGEIQAWLEEKGK